jgi:hypothetical protein
VRAVVGVGVHHGAFCRPQSQKSKVVSPHPKGGGRQQLERDWGRGEGLEVVPRRRV